MCYWRHYLVIVSEFQNILIASFKSHPICQKISAYFQPISNFKPHLLLYLWKLLSTAIRGGNSVLSTGFPEISVVSVLRSMFFV
jgi:hypothetical protein